MSEALMCRFLIVFEALASVGPLDTKFPWIESELVRKPSHDSLDVEAHNSNSENVVHSVDTDSFRHPRFLLLPTVRHILEARRGVQSSKQLWHSQ